MYIWWKKIIIIIVSFFALIVTYYSYTCMYGIFSIETNFQLMKPFVYVNLQLTDMEKHLYKRYLLLRLDVLSMQTIVYSILPRSIISWKQDSFEQKRLKYWKHVFGRIIVYNDLVYNTYVVWFKSSECII